MNDNIQSSISNAASTVATIANEFIHLGRLEPNYPAIDQMKLQKLLFYAHAWHLALYDKPLFDADFEAWPWGPVVRDIYSQTKQYGNKPIQDFVLEIQTGVSPEDVKFVTPRLSPSALATFIKNIWDVHKQYTGIQLSNSTHAAGEPWSIIKSNYGDLSNKPIIPNDIIAAVFKKKLENATHHKT